MDANDYELICVDRRLPLRQKKFPTAEPNRCYRHFGTEYNR
ncbi:MAG: hypothetical protein [Olavius algarvensis Gamma 1 endosymbiont]|nr:MAG: hypothetical protein [Olavius algarvensis Gamma 1 endosymbiont]